MKKSIFVCVAVFFLFSCSKQTGEANVGQFSTQVSQFPEGITPSNPQQDLQGSDAIAPQGIIARKSAWLRHHTQVNTNVYVLGNCSGEGCLDPAEAPTNPNTINNANSELTIGVSVTVPAGRVLKADKIRLKNRATVLGTTEANTYAQQKSAKITNKVSTLGALPYLPFFLSGTPGTRNINDATATLAPAQYRNLTVRKDKTVTLTGGFYQFHDIDLKRKSSLICQTQCFVTVKVDVISEKEITLSATSGNPNDFVVYVEGGSAAAEPMAAAAKAVQLGGMSHVTANIYAVNGRLQFGAATIAQGAFIGNHVRIEPNSIVTAGPVPVGTVKLFEAGVPDSIEIPGKVKLEIPACALAEDTVISVQPKAGAGIGRISMQNWNFYQDSAVEFSPAGLEFNCATALTQNFDQLNLPATVNPLSLVSAYSNDGTHFEYLPVSPASGSGAVKTGIHHFTVYMLASPTSAASYHQTIAKKGSTIYAASYPPAIVIYDASNPSGVQKISELAISDASCTYLQPQNLIREGSRLISINYCWAGYYRMLITTYDISVDQAPGEMGRAYVDNQYWYPDYVHYHAGVLYNNSIYYANFNRYISKTDLSNSLAPVNQIGLPDNNAYYLFGNGSYLYRDRFTSSIQIIDGITLSDTGSTIAKLLPNDYVQAMAFTSNSVIYWERFNSAPYPTFIVKQDVASPTSFANPRYTSLSFYQKPGITLSQISRLTVDGSRILALGYGYDNNTGYAYAASWQDTSTIPVVEDAGYFSGIDYFSSASNAIFEFPYAYIPVWNQPPLRILAFQPPPEPPVVVNVTPNDGATEVSIYTPISITFGQQMNSATLTTTTTTACSGSVQVSEDNFLTCVPMSSPSGFLTNGGKTANFAATSLGPNKTFKIKLFTTIQGANGGFLQSPYLQTFGFATVSPVSVASSPLAVPRTAHSAVRLSDGRVLISGGITNNLEYLSSCEIFDPAANGGAGVLAPTGSLSVPRAYHSATLLPNGKVLIVGGTGGATSYLSASHLGSAEIFDPAGNNGQGTFTSLGNMQARHGWGHSVNKLSDGKVLIIGGYYLSGTGVLTSTEVFDPSNNSFTLKTPILSPRYGHTATDLPDGRILIAGGQNDTGALSTAEIFNPVANGGNGLSVAAPAMGTLRSFHSGISLLDGRVLILGGSSTLVTEIFDPAANGGLGAFVAGASLAIPRNQHSALLLPNGNVQIAGGTSGLNSVEVFNPYGNSGLGIVMNSVSMTSMRRLHSSTLLQNGKVLITGGSFGFSTNSINATTELWQ